MLHRVRFGAIAIWRARIANLNGQNGAIVIAESLARVIAAIQIASACWWSYAAPQNIEISPHTPCVCCAAIRIIPLRAQRLKNSRSPSGIEIFNRDWNFQASHPPNPYVLWGILKVRDWKFQARLEFSIEIENSNRDWFFFNLWALRVVPCGIAEWLAGVDRARWTLAIGDLAIWPI